MSADTLGKVLEVAVKPLIGYTRVVQQWAGNRVISGKGGGVTHAPEIPSTSERHLCACLCVWMGKTSENTLTMS